MQQIEYSALKYYNNIISEECLYVGMLFHNITTNQRYFRYISNFRRFHSFDDEADIDFVKLYLEGIKNQVENNIFNYKDPFSISEYIKIYVNEFRFTTPLKMDIEDDEDFIDDLMRLYIKYDVKKERRLSDKETKQYVRRILAANAELSFPKVEGIYDEKVTFDYLVGNVAVKLFSFKEKDALKLIPTAKQWAFNANELKDRYRVFFLYDDASNASSELKIVLKILQKNANVYQFQEGVEKIVKAIS